MERLKVTNLSSIKWGEQYTSVTLHTDSWKIFTISGRKLLEESEREDSVILKCHKGQSYKAIKEFIDGKWMITELEKIVFDFVPVIDGRYVTKEEGWTTYTLQDYDVDADVYKFLRHGNGGHHIELTLKEILDLQFKR